MAEDFGTVQIRPILLRGFRFQVKLFQSEGGPDPRAPLGDGGFQEVSGLDVDLDVQELLEGGRNDGAVRLVGRAKNQQLVLKRGMFFSQPGARVNGELWDWLQGIYLGRRPVARYDGVVEVLEGDAVVARWTFDRGLPARIVGPQLNAKTGEVAIEELHVAHEGLRLEVA